MDGVQDMLTIGQLAKQVQIPVSTVRYYERRGLLLPDRRTHSKYRLFGPEALVRLRFIRAAQESGFTLENILALLDYRDGKGDPCEEVQELIVARLEAIEEEMTKLDRIRAVLRETLERCREPHSAGCCEAVDRLDQRAAGT